MNVTTHSISPKILALAVLSFSAMAAQAQVNDKGDIYPPVYVSTAPLSTISIHPTGSVLKVKLDTKLESKTAKVGDTFTATLDMGKSKDYFGLPAGTKVIGHVTEAKAKEGKNAGMLALHPDTILLTDGSKYPIDAVYMKIDKKTVTSDKGRLMTTNAYRGGTQSSYIVTGALVGAGIGLLAGGDILAGGLIGGLIGFFIAQQQGVTAQDVTLKPGTVFGVRLNQDTPIEVAVHQ